jgi:hypothetical protein
MQERLESPDGGRWARKLADGLPWRGLEIIVLLLERRLLVEG